MSDVGCAIDGVLVGLRRRDSVQDREGGIRHVRLSLFLCHDLPQRVDPRSLLRFGGWLMSCCRLGTRHAFCCYTHGRGLIGIAVSGMSGLPATLIVRSQEPNTLHSVPKHGSVDVIAGRGIAVTVLTNFVRVRVRGERVG